jgi:hypothetical protein
MKKFGKLESEVFQRMIESLSLNVSLSLCRYVREKSEYKGIWKLPKRRAKKHPLAPKRPMSAFLKYSQKRRTMVKVQNPNMSNTDISRLLGEMWRSASPSEKAPYVEEEKLERAKYKEGKSANGDLKETKLLLAPSQLLFPFPSLAIKKFRENQAKLEAASRTSHQSVRQQVAVTEKPQRHIYDMERESFEPFRVQPVEAAPSAVDRRIFRSFSGLDLGLESGQTTRLEHHAFLPSVGAPAAGSVSSKDDARVSHYYKPKSSEGDQAKSEQRLNPPRYQHQQQSHVYGQPPYQQGKEHSQLSIAFAQNIRALTTTQFSFLLRWKHLLLRRFLGPRPVVPSSSSSASNNFSLLSCWPLSLPLFLKCLKSYQADMQI